VCASPLRERKTESELDAGRVLKLHVCPARRIGFGGEAEAIRPPGASRVKLGRSVGRSVHLDWPMLRCIASQCSEERVQDTRQRPFFRGARGRAYTSFVYARALRWRRIHTVRPQHSLLDSFRRTDWYAHSVLSAYRLPPPIRLYVGSRWPTREQSSGGYAHAHARAAAAKVRPNRGVRAVGEYLGVLLLLVVPHVHATI
jgi:hypothetical protein